MISTSDDLVQTLISTLAGIPEDRIRQEINALALNSKERSAKRVQLMIQRLRFSGDLHGDFRFSPGVNILRAGNLRGKTTVLQLIHFGLTGSLKLKPDMSARIHLVDLDFSLDSSTYTVHADRTQPRCQGFLDLGSMDHSADGPERREFKTLKEMTETMESFFNEKFGFEELHGTQKDSRKDSDALNVNRTSYETYFKGLYVNQDTGYSHLVTDTLFSNQYTKTVGTLLGYRGLRDYYETETALALTKNARAKEEAHLRRPDSTNSARRPSDAIARDLEGATRTVEELKLKRADALVRATSSEVDRRLARLTESIVLAQDAIIGTRRDLTDTERAKDVDEALVLALKDAIESKQHLSPLAPHHCPVCDTAITKTRTQTRQGHGQCLLCAETVHPDSERRVLSVLHQRLTEAQASLQSRELQLRTARRGAEKATQIASELAKEKTELQTQLRAAHANGSTFDTRIEAEMRKIGKLEAEREEYQRASALSTAPLASDLSLRQLILEGLLSHLRTVHAIPNAEVKLAFASRVLDYARKCGFGSLESIKLDPQLRPELVQNGSLVAFPDLSPGEKSRFVLAFFFALATAPAIDIPGALHPGLLLIDSPGKEEMVAKDFQAVVGLLQFIQENHAGQVQAIVASAYREIRGAAPAESAYFMEDDEEYLFP